MKYNKKKLELYDVLWSNSMKTDAIQKYTELVNDTKKDKRLESQECQFCFYSGRVGGCAMTTTNCRICDKEMIFGSTNTDDLCIDCAKDHKLCKHCCADIEYRNRKKL